MNVNEMLTSLRNVQRFRMNAFRSRMGPGHARSPIEIFIPRTCYQIYKEGNHQGVANAVCALLKYSRYQIFFLSRESRANVILIERVQRAATKMVAGLKFMYYEMRFAVLDLFPLEYRRLRGDLILTYALFEQGLANRFFTVDQQTHGGDTSFSTVRQFDDCYNQQAVEWLSAILSLPMDGCRQVGCKSHKLIAQGLAVIVTLSRSTVEVPLKARHPAQVETHLLCTTVLGVSRPRTILRLLDNVLIIRDSNISVDTDASLAYNHKAHRNMFKALEWCTLRVSVLASVVRKITAVLKSNYYDKLSASALWLSTINMRFSRSKTPVKNTSVEVTANVYGFRHCPVLSAPTGPRQPPQNNEAVETIPDTDGKLVGRFNGIKRSMHYQNSQWPHHLIRLPEGYLNKPAPNIMSYRTQPLPSSSDEGSDGGEEDVFWKRKPPCAQKRAATDSDVTMVQATKKRPRNNVWLNVLNECALDEALSGANFHEKRDTSRGVESYLVQSDTDQVDNIGWESRSPSCDKPANRFSGRLPPRRWDPSISRKHVSVNFDSPSDAVKAALVELLNEPNDILIGQIVDVLGVQRSLEFYFLTEDVEEAGGIYYADGSQRRSRGGVFLNLIKRSDEVTEDEKKAMFALSRRVKDRIKRKRKQLKQAKEKQAITSSVTLRDVNVEVSEIEDVEATTRVSASFEGEGSPQVIDYKDEHDGGAPNHGLVNGDNPSDYSIPLSVKTHPADPRMDECEEGELTSTESEDEPTQS
ncbi:phosphorylated adapter RNA export protein [Clonorchis sinensis]|uniref:Phosphorylated adapter RNA export protein n=1 Tax=Clonorchis sinensis TaxID=79923 RepID=G7YLQ1_CLOSI|nr:phosphorylated adapter RNA export protein [Clonorchis sinensis]